MQEQYQLLGGYDIVTNDGGLEESCFHSIMGSFVVAGWVFDRLLETFNQGQLKFDLTRFLLIDADMQIWDEPLNYIAVLSRDQIEAAIVALRLAITLVEHDSRFVDNIGIDVIGL